MRRLRLAASSDFVLSSRIFWVWSAMAVWVARSSTLAAAPSALARRARASSYLPAL
jgi:hypothetical protein